MAKESNTELYKKHKGKNEILFCLFTRQVMIYLDDEIKVNYNKFGRR